MKNNRIKELEKEIELLTKIRDLEQQIADYRRMTQPYVPSYVPYEFKTPLIVWGNDGTYSCW